MPAAGAGAHLHLGFPSGGRQTATSGKRPRGAASSVTHPGAVGRRVRADEARGHSGEISAMTKTGSLRQAVRRAATDGGAHAGTVAVADLEGRGSLAACRSLARAGYRVLGLSSSRFAPGSWSRACDRRILLPDPRHETARYVGALVDAIAGQRLDAFVPGSDATLLAVSTHRSLIEPHLDLRLPDHAVVLRVTDKVALGEAAALVGLAPPAAILCETIEAVRVAAPEVGYPAGCASAGRFESAAQRSSRTGSASSVSRCSSRRPSRARSTPSRASSRTVSCARSSSRATAALGPSTRAPPRSPRRSRPTRSSSTASSGSSRRSAGAGSSRWR